jgi:hypothetical protein
MREWTMPEPIYAAFPGSRGEETALLNWDDLEVVQDLLAEIAPGWSAELNHASLDDSTIVVTPAGANDIIGPAFVLHRSRGRVHLDQFRWDEYRKLGAFRTLNEAFALLRSRLVPLVTRRPPFADR